MADSFIQPRWPSNGAGSCPHWDPISDQLLSIAIAGATAATDPNGGLLRQILHGGLGYDDPIEVTAVGEGATATAQSAAAATASTSSTRALPAGSTADRRSTPTIPPTSTATTPPTSKLTSAPKTNSLPALTRLYPVYDAAAGSLQLTLNGAGEVISRSLMQGAYGEDTVALNGVAIDRIAIKAKKDSSGNIESVEITMRATEALDPATVASGARLATVTAEGTVVRLTTVPASLLTEDTIHWMLTAAQWGTLTSSLPAVIGGITLTPASLSVAATNTLRASAWSSSAPVLPAPDWVVGLQPVHSTAALPVEIRNPLSDLAEFSVDTAKTLYGMQSLAALDPQRQASGVRVPAPFQAFPFEEPVTRHAFVRARWYDAERGALLSPDPYRESSNLYAFVGGDPVNGRDPSGLAGYFFDGTWNDERQMKNPTNVAKLRRLYQGERFYLPGVGTRWYSKYIGGLSGAGGQARIYEMYDSLVDAYNRGDTSIDIFGFSRGGALAVDFANFIRERGIPDKSSAYQKPVGDGSTVTRYRKYFHPEVRFLGVFDVVGSFGMPGDDIDPGHDLHRPTNVKNIRHATAQNESRWAFPLTSMLDAPGRTPANVIERAFRGAHSDVGGGYPDNDELSRVPLGWMWQEATKAGVPLAYLPENERTATRNLIQHDERSWLDPILNWLDRRDTSRSIYYQQQSNNLLDFVPSK